MGQKVNPHGLRVGVIKDWDSRWFAGKATFGDTLVEDYKIRDYIMNKRMLTRANGEKSDQQLSRAAGIAQVEIERSSDNKIKIHILTAKPGMLIGAKGAEIEKLRAEISKIAGGKDVNLNIVEVKNPDMNAKLVAENIAMQSGAKGIKTMVSGRLGGAEIARSENYHEGTIPLQTLRADIDYGVARANTTYGVIGVKVWIYKGEVLKGEIPAQRTTEKPRRRNNDNRSRRPRVEKKEGGND